MSKICKSCSPWDLLRSEKQWIIIWGKLHCLIRQIKVVYFAFVNALFLDVESKLVIMRYLYVFDVCGGKLYVVNCKLHRRYVVERKSETSISRQSYLHCGPLQRLPYFWSPTAEVPFQRSAENKTQKWNRMYNIKGNVKSITIRLAYKPPYLR